jgi:hypothetical protein
MSHSEQMILQLQPFQRKSEVYQELFEAEGIQFDNRDSAVADLKLQLSVDTATWALSIYETELNIPIESSKPVSERRSVIKSKRRGTGQVDASLIKLVADSYSNGDVDVAFDGSIRITFTSVFGIPPNMQDLQKAIEEIKPAHLGITYILTYITFGQLEAYTFGQIEASGLTFGQLETILP